MIKYNNILIVGLGMMGASLCKSIKKNKISKKITGFDTNSKSLDYALKNKIINIGKSFRFNNLFSVVSNSSIVKSEI